MLTLGSWGWNRASAPAPATQPSGAVSIPDRLYPVPRWLPVGDLSAPAIAVTLADRGTWWGGDELQLAAISAATGEYHFVDLPDMDDSEEYALSPNGRFLAYWSTGTPSGDPNTSFGQVDEPTTGITVYDLLRNEVGWHRDLVTEHGIQSSGLLWSDPTTLVYAFGQIVAGDNGSQIDQGSSTNYRSFVWPIGKRPYRSRLAGLAEVDAAFAAARDGVILNPGRVIDLNANTSRIFRVRSQSAATGPTGQWLDLRSDGVFAVIGGRGLGSISPNKVTMGTYSKGKSESETRVVPGTSDTVQVLGWRGGRLVVTRWPGEGKGTRIQAINPESGRTQTLVQAPRTGGLWLWADDLLTAEVVPGTEPPSPVDPRLLLGGGLVIVVGAGLALFGWRRRDHA